MGISLALTVQARTGIAILYNQRPPYLVNTSSGVSGLTGAPVVAAFRATGIAHHWEEIPSNRQLRDLRLNRRPVCAVGWFKNPNRMGYAKFTLPIYQDRPMVGLALANNGRLTSGETLSRALGTPHLRLLVKSGYSYGRYVDGLIRKIQPLTVTITGENLDMLHMLNQGRADFFFVSEEEADRLIKLSGFSAVHYRYIHFADTPPGNKRYLMCSRKVSDQSIQRLNRWIGAHIRIGRDN